MPKKEVAFYPGVKEEDFKKLPRDIQFLAINAITAIAEGKLAGDPLTRKIFAKSGCKKCYIYRPEDIDRIEANQAAGRPVTSGLSKDGGFRIVFRETTVRDRPAIAIVSIGPRAGHAVYNTAESRLRAQEMRQKENRSTTRSNAQKIAPRSPSDPQKNAARRTNPSKPNRGRGL